MAETATLGFIARFVDRASGPMRQVGKRFDQLNTRTSRLGKTLNKQEGAFRTAFVGLTLPLVGFAALSLKVAGDFDAAMRSVAGKTGAVGSELDSLRQKAKDLGASTQFTARETADAMDFLAQAGLKTNEILESIGPTLQLATAANLELGQSADIVTNIMAGYGKQVGDLNNVNDILVNTVNNSNTNLVQLSESMKLAGPVFANMNIPMEETVGILGTMATAGFKGSLAGTSLRKAMISLLNPTGAAKKVFKDLKIDLDQFKDGQGRIKSFTDVLAALSKAGIRAGQVTQIFGLRAGPALLPLLGKGIAGIRELTETVKQQGSASRIAALKMAGFSGGMKVLKSAFEALQIAFAESGLIDFAEKMIRGLAKLLRFMSKLPKPILFTIGVFGLLIAVLPPLLLAVTFVVAAFGSFTNGLRSSIVWMRAYNIQAIKTARANALLAASSQRGGLQPRNALGQFTKGPAVAAAGKGPVSGILGNLGKTFSTLGKKIGSFVKGIGGKLLAPLAIVLGVFALWKKNIFGVRDAFASMIAFIRDRIIKPIKFWFTFIKVILQALFTRSVSLSDVNFLGDKFGLVIDILNNPFVKAIRSIIAFFERLSIAFEKVGASIGTFTSGMIEMGGIGAGIGFLFGGPLGAAIGAGIGVLIAGIINIVQNWDEFKKLVSTTWDLLMDSGPVKSVINLGKTIAKFFDPKNNAFVAFVVSIFDFVSGFVKIFAKAAVTIGRFIVGIHVLMFRSIGAAIKSGVSQFFDFILDFLPEEFPFIKFLLDKLSSVSEGAKKIWGEVVEFLKDAFGEIPKIFNFVLNAMRFSFFFFAEKIQNVLAKILDVVPESLGGSASDAAAARVKALEFGASGALAKARSGGVLAQSGRGDIIRRIPGLFTQLQGLQKTGGENNVVNIDLSGSGFEGRLDEIRPFLQEIVRVLKIKGITKFIDKETMSTDDEMEG